MNIAGPLGLQMSHVKSFGVPQQRKAVLAIGVIGLGLLLVACMGLWSPIGRGERGCVVSYVDGKYGADEGLRTRLLDLGKSKRKGHFWAAFVGDSIARHVLIAFMRTVGVDMDGITFERHQDFEHIDGDSNMRWTLHWAPFPRNVTDVMAGFREKEGKTVPDVLVVSTVLWHVLWVHDVDAYREGVVGMVQAVQGFEKVAVLNAPRVYSELLEDAQKKAFMVAERIDGYNAVLQQATCGDENGTGKLVDVFGATSSCGIGCSVDGIHSHEELYGGLVVPMVMDGIHL